MFLPSGAEAENIEPVGWRRRKGALERGTFMIYHGIEIPSEKLAEFCRRNHIRKLSLFGSILSDDFGPDSDVDFLVEFEPGRTPSLITMAGLEIELSEMINRKVDLRTAGDLSRYFRDEVVERAAPQYALEG